MPTVAEWSQWSDRWDEAPDLWEHQGTALDAGELISSLQPLLDYLPRWRGLPVVIDLFDGLAARRLVPVEVGLTGSSNEPAAIVLTVVAEDSA